MKCVTKETSGTSIRPLVFWLSFSGQQNNSGGCVRQDKGLHAIRRAISIYRCGTETNNGSSATHDCQPSTPGGGATGTVRFSPMFGLSTELVTKGNLAILKEI